MLAVMLQMAVALGGRIAEELIFGENDITTGASGDFQQVTRTARLMVTQLGFSKKLGQVKLCQGWKQHGSQTALVVLAFWLACRTFCLSSWVCMRLRRLVLIRTAQ